MSTRLPGKRYKIVFDKGRSLRGHLFNAWCMKSSSVRSLAGVVVSKKSFHDAVDRNRAKRLLREAFRLLVDSFPEHTEWIFVGRASLGGKRLEDVKMEMRKFIRKGVEREC